MINNTNNLYSQIADSPEVFQDCQEIGNAFGLHLDKIGELDAQVRLVIRGVAKSSTFIDDIMNRLEIDNELANKIGAEVSNKIFQTLKEKIHSQNTLPDRESHISAIEKAGGFEIEREGSYGNFGNTKDVNQLHNTPTTNMQVSETKIDQKPPTITPDNNIQPIAKPIQTPATAPTSVSFTEAIGENLLAEADKPTEPVIVETEEPTIPENLPTQDEAPTKPQTEVADIPTAPVKPRVYPEIKRKENRPYDNDPYREPIQ